MQPISASTEEIHEIELEHLLVGENAKVAEENRALLDRYHITAIDILGAIGSGKTTLISRVVEQLKVRWELAVLSGAAITCGDSESIRGQGVPVVQIATMDAGHLDANLVGKALKNMNLDRLDLVFIENIGNLVSPTQYPLGSNARVVVVSVTEGPWVVRKHPQIFLAADLVVINKIELAEYMAVSLEGLIHDVFELKPDLHVVPVSCKTGAGLSELLTRIRALHES